MIPKVIDLADDLFHSTRRVEPLSVIQIREEATSLSQEVQARTDLIGQLNDRSETLLQEIETLQNRIESTEQGFLRDPLAVWHRAKFLDPADIWLTNFVKNTANVRAPYIAAGVDGDPGGSAQLVLLFSRDGKAWRGLKIEHKGKPVYSRVDKIIDIGGNRILLIANKHNYGRENYIIIYNGNDDSTQIIEIPSSDGEVITDVAFSEDRNYYILSKTSRRSYQLKNFSNDGRLSEIGLPSVANIRFSSVSFTPSGNLLLAGATGSPKIFEQDSNNNWLPALVQFNGNGNGNGNVAGFLAVGDRLFSYGNDGEKPFIGEYLENSNWRIRNLDIDGRLKFVTSLEGPH